MLVKYKNDYEKIAMGFLSYLPDLKVMSNLKTELSLYTTDPDHELYLYKENNDDDFIGVVGVETGSDFLLVRHISLSPSVRDQATQFAILDDLAKLCGKDKKLMGSLETTQLIVAWERARKEQGFGTDAGSR